MIPKTSFSQETNVDSLVKQHKKIAVLPLKVYYIYKTLPEGLKVGDVRNKEYEDGFLLQKKFNDYLKLKKESVTVEIQSFDETNSLLAENEITLQDLKDLPADFICKALKVDGIIDAEIRLNTFINNEEIVGRELLSIAIGVGNKNKLDNSVLSKMKISDGNTGEMIGEFPLVLVGTMFKSTEKVIEKMLWLNFKNTPYYKK
ncbi:hypothetical protein VB776_17775 [Arcicella sp. DC2W]|uniref:Uncharacterized protein n=1 Tax=Arcicella gelida TaxID=2984195 RepID=A0ABU5S8I6_9BACT|nr:hypothetical protein [Arcicella sp. DC2W]MEA5404788.1 hypothetical protein [Arcicella sp. DC2W]